MIAFDDVTTGAEQEECTSAIRALGLTLFQAFVANQSALLITHETTDGDPCKGSRGDITVHLGGRDKLWQYGLAKAEEFEKR